MHNTTSIMHIMHSIIFWHTLASTQYNIYLSLHHPSSRHTLMSAYSSTSNTRTVVPAEWITCPHLCTPSPSHNRSYLDKRSEGWQSPCSPRRQTQRGALTPCKIVNLYRNTLANRIPTVRRKRQQWLFLGKSRIWIGSSRRNCSHTSQVQLS